MTRTENDLRDALRDLERRADERGAPSTSELLTRVDERRNTGHARQSATRMSRFPRWSAPLAAAAVVAAAAITVAALDAGGGTGGNAAGQPSVEPTVGPTATSSPVSPPSASTLAAVVLNDASTALAATSWTPPSAKEFYYVRTNQGTTWTSVSGARAGRGKTDTGEVGDVPGCRDGRYVSVGQSGSCDLNDVPHYRNDAPTVPQAWDAYLETMAPSAKADIAQGKIIVQVLHQDLVAPRAAAALLRYTETCPGLHEVAVAPVAGRTLVGVTCTSMTNGSYGLAFDASTHGFVGFVGVTESGVQDGPAEVIAETGIVAALGDTP